MNATKLQEHAQIYNFIISIIQYHSQKEVLYKIK